MPIFSRKSLSSNRVHNFLFLSIILFLPHVYTFKLNKPRILLPYNYGLPNNYTLIVSDVDATDCFVWKSTNAHYIIVSPVSKHSSEGNCSQEAVVSVVNSASSRKDTRVTATLIGNTEVKLHCDVILDSPVNIKLSSLVDVIQVGGPPEVVTIIATDKFGHPFSSINGLQFEWHLDHEPYGSTNPNASEVVRLKKFTDSSYTSAVDSNGWESRGLFGDSVLVEAVNKGSCSISAALKYMNTQKLSTNQLKLETAPDYQIYPSTHRINLLNGDEVKISMMKDGEFYGNKEDYDIMVGDPETAYLFDNSILKANAVGLTHIDVDVLDPNYPDAKVDCNVVGHQDVSLVFQISGGGFTILEEMKMYTITVELLDQDDNEVFLSDSLRMMVTFPKHFYVHSSTPNGTYHVVQTAAPGKGVIKAEFKGLIKSDGSFFKQFDLFSSVEVTVCQKLEIFPPYVLLPSDSITDPLHEINLVVNGGSGSYLWTSNNNSAASISFSEDASHVGKLHILKEANFIVTVTDKNNINFISTSKISIQPVIDVETYPTVVEAEIGNTLILPIALLAYENEERKIIRKFDDCSKIQPTVEIIEKHVMTYDQEPHIPAFGKGCLSLQMRCQSPGYSRINVSYKNLRTTTVLACFKPLKPVHPVRVAVLAVGASKEVAFEGGPRKWPLFKTGHYTNLEASDPDLVSIELVRDPIRYNRDLTVFRVSCKALGENTLTFRIGNNPSATNVHPAKAEGTIKVICSKPHSVHLKLFKTNKNPKKPLLEDNIVKVPFYGNKVFSVDVWVKDEMGRKFSNMSSLSLKWDVSDETLATPESFSGFTTHENGVAGYRKVSRDFKEFKMSGDAGNLKISAKIEGYRPEVLTKEGISAPIDFEEISSSVDLNLISLRDYNAGLYSSYSEDSQNGEESCDSDSCKL